MKPEILSPDEQEQVRRAMAYWTKHWDWECPTLFGIELEELQAVLRDWPRSAAHLETETLAAIGALRELLHGASTPPSSHLTEILGLEYQATCALCEKVRALYRDDAA